MLSMELISVLSGVVIGGITAYGVLSFKRKGVAPGKILEDVQKVVLASDTIIDVAEDVCPNSQANTILNTIKEWGPIAAGFAQQLCHSGDISKEERTSSAEKIVCAVLKELNIDVTDNQKIIIDAAIKDMVNKFGHKEPSEAEKQAKEQTLLNQVTQLVSENTQLKQTIAQVNATTACTVQPTQAV